MEKDIKGLVLRMSKRIDMLTERLDDRYDQYFDGFNDCLIEYVEALTKILGKHRRL